MKLSMIVLTCLVSASAFAADGEAPRNEARVRTLGESVLAVSTCTPPVVRSYEFDSPIVKSDGTYSQDKNGNLRYEKLTKLVATSSLNVTKCAAQEQYMASVTGSFWNSKESEIPGTAKAYGTMGVKQYDFEKAQDMNLNKLRSAAGNDGFFQDGGQVQMLHALEDGLKAQALASCQAQVAQLQGVVVMKKDSACRAQ
jgi:hypothetical protein